ncbi:hypothetical protein HZB04_03915 [Candidatus Wolfebacteria bacterium]|nr:hypothetical protein [Candidatus Wolfebacteria bacterium]
MAKSKKIKKFVVVGTDVGVPDVDIFFIRLAKTLEFEEVNFHRNTHCQYYDQYLNCAVKYGFISFSCVLCPQFKFELQKILLKERWRRKIH